MVITKSKKIDDTVNKWLHKLIDLSRRNRQLYFRRTKISTVKFIKPSFQEIYDLLVNKRKEMTIIYRDIENIYKKKEDLTDFTDEFRKDPLEYKKPLKRGEILTDKEDKELYKSLRNLLSRSRSSFQEQGVNVLFLAFGFLEWKDTAFAESKNLSPIILVPVLLKRISLLQPYKIQFFDDDIILNPALAVKLENDFKIKLPRIEEDIEDIEEFFRNIESIIHKYSEARNWKINKDVYLSFFSFSKLSMYRDLKDNKRLINNNEILNDLILEKSTERIDILAGEDLDKKDSKDIFHILDADSSQQNAILNAEQGKTFTIQGPPGTGKSQTIANMIASSLAHGKKVLFVSEKMAALEVVMKRLEECGFDEFCLELHSYKSNKKTVYEELGRCLLSQEAYKDPQIHIFKELDQNKAFLNDYFKSIKKKYPPFDISAFYIHGKLVGLSDLTFYPKYALKIEGFSRKEFGIILNIFKRINLIRPLFNNYFENPWYGFDLSNLTFEFRNNVIYNFEEIIDIIHQIEGYSKHIQKYISSSELLKFYQISSFYEYFTKNNIEFLLFDLEELLIRFKIKYKSFLRFLKSNYKKDIKKIRFLLGIDEKLKYLDFVEILEEALNYKNVIQISNLSKWELINVKSRWKKLFQFNQNFYEELIQLIRNYEEKIKYLRSLFLELDTKNFYTKFEQATFNEIINWLQNKIKNVDKIDDWDSIDSLRLELKELSYERLFFTSLKFQSKIINLERVFEKFIYTKHLDYIYSKNTILLKFKSTKYNSILEEFKKLDKRHIKTSRKRILYQLWNLRPKNQWVMADSSAINILKKEIIKKRRVKPIRLLFSQIPNLISSIKPCLLMSPLSISKYLVPSIYKFDIVIFDEASQVRPEDAIGAIMRGNQVIIVGDQKQLPPTSFFQTLSEDYNEDDYEDVDFESILERFELSNFPEVMLNHHYRSRDESLIAFSNYHFYDNRLYTYPSIYHSKENIGIEFEYIPDGIYDRGKSRKNKREARRVAELVIEHFINNPEFSLGVVAFSQAQQDAITVEIEKLLRENIEYEHFTQSGGLEQFFVKNLENVQGDERDVMFFSVGYGKDLDGKLSLNFGPLNRVGGQRRLNVAITRARYRVKIISSIQSAEIDLSKTRSEGIKLLKQYLEYAEHKGEISYIRERNIFVAEEFDSPFEMEVYNALKSLDYSVHTQIGCSGFKIDLGIVHPEYPGQYILGIECDGSQYHSSFTARDRDRIRQEILESLGWTIHRIWSYDWVTNPKKEFKKIVKLIKDLETIKNSPIIKKKKKPSSNITNKNKSFDVQEFKKRNNNRSKKNIDFEHLPKDFSEYEKFTDYYHDIFQYQYHYNGRYHYSKTEATPLINKIVTKESPIHINELYKRISECCRYTRLGPKMKRTIDYAIEAGDVYRIKNTVWSRYQKDIPVRYPNLYEVKRQIRNIPIEEIAQAICILLRDSISLSENETILYTGKIFGFSSTSGKSKEYILSAISSLLLSGYVIRETDKLLLKDRNIFKISLNNLTT